MIFCLKRYIAKPLFCNSRDISALMYWQCSPCEISMQLSDISFLFGEMLLQMSDILFSLSEISLQLNDTSQILIRSLLLFQNSSFALFSPKMLLKQAVLEMKTPRQIRREALPSDRKAKGKSSTVHNKATDLVAYCSTEKENSKWKISSSDWR